MPFLQDVKSAESVYTFIILEKLIKNSSQCVKYLSIHLNMQMEYD